MIVNKKYHCILFVIIFSSVIFTDDIIDEDALFGDTSIYIDVETLEDSSLDASAEEKPSINFSGAVRASGTFNLNRKWFEKKNREISETSLDGSIVGSFNGDFRLPRSVKSFINTEVLYNGSYDSLYFSVNELFLDWNIKHRVFFRAGKQILQWGRGYFFNPVDIINIDKKQFFDELLSREGTFGLKMHAPLHTRFNLYSFVNMQSVKNPEDLSFSVKTEFLTGPVEWALSGWGQNKKGPAYALDLSTSIGPFSVTAEAILFSKMDIIDSMSYEQSVPQTNIDPATIELIEQNPFLAEQWYAEAAPTIVPHYKTHRWFPRISFNIGREFDFGNIPDRIRVNFETYYNHAGKNHSSFKRYLPPKSIADSLEVREKLLLSAVQYLEPNNFSQWYAAGFITIGRFILTDMTLSTNALYNVNQNTALVSVHLNYITLHNLSFDLLLSGYPGKNYTEYTVFGQGLTTELRIGIIF